MAKKKSQTEAAMQSMRERKQQELEARLQRVRKARSTYQRKISAASSLPLSSSSLCVLCFRPAIEPMTVNGTRISMKDRRIFFQEL